MSDELDKPFEERDLDYPVKYPIEIIKALHEVMGKIGYIPKMDKNEFHRYSYASEATLLRHLRPAIVEAGLIFIPSAESYSAPDQYGNITTTYEYTLVHVSGAVWPEKIKAFGCGNDRDSKGHWGDKGLYKAITGTNKYFLFKLFQLETGDDPERTEKHEQKGKEEPKQEAKAKTGKTITDKQRKMFFVRVEESHMTHEKAKDWLHRVWGYESTEDIKMSDFQEILKELESMVPNT